MSDETVATPSRSRVPSSHWRDLLRTADQFGAYCWMERGLFRTLGDWSLSETEPEKKLALDAWSHQHAWHGEIWFDRLPDLAQLDAEALIVAPSAAFAGLFDEVSGLTTTGERFTALDFLVSHLLGAYRAELDGANIANGASLRRWLPFLIGDLVTESAALREVLDKTQPGAADEHDSSIKERIAAALESTDGVVLPAP